MTTYRDLLELVAKREMGILGRAKTLEVYRDLGFPIDEDGSLHEGDYAVADLEKVMVRLNQKFGAVAVMGCKIAVSRKAKEGNLNLPEILRIFSPNITH